jgi:hypothetical protein
MWGLSGVILSLEFCNGGDNGDRFILALLKVCSKVGRWS